MATAHETGCPELVNPWEKVPDIIKETKSETLEK